MMSPSIALKVMRYFNTQPQKQEYNLHLKLKPLKLLAQGLEVTR